MTKSGFLWRAYAAYAALILAVAAVIGFAASRRIRADAEDRTLDSLRSTARLFISGMAPLASEEASHEKIITAARSAGVRLTLIRPDGSVAADSHSDPAVLGDQSDRPEVIQAAASGEGSASRLSAAHHERLLYLAMRVGAPDAPTGYVRVAAPADGNASRNSALIRVPVLATTGVALLALLPGAILIRRIQRPLRQLAHSAESVSRGEKWERVDDGGVGEIAELSRSFDRTARRLEERLETINSDHTKLLTILGGMVEGVIAVDHEERLIHMNSAAGEIIGVETEGCIGRRLWEVTRNHEISKLLGDAIGGGARIRGEMRQGAGGSERHIEMLAAPIMDGSGDLAGAVMVIHDVTELRRLESIRRDFVTNVSHELKTPITAIRGMVETLLDDREAPTEVRERFLGRIHSQSMRLSALVTDLLALSRVESGTATLEQAPLDLRTPTALAADALQTSAEARRVTLNVTLGSAPVPVRGDAESLRQVVTNLLDNALKYTPEEGRIDLTIRVRGGEATIEVRDTGIGIEPRHQERIFERFYRVDKARSRELGGTGLGLSIVKHVALAHRGRVAVESTPGRGSTFRIYLPLRPGD